MRRLRTTGPAGTAAAGREYARLLGPGDVVAITGTLGTGKTVFAAGLCEGLGVRVPVTSPTFTLINEYALPFGTLVHADLYRISTAAEVAELGLEEYFTDRAVCVIEWADRVPGILPPSCRRVALEHGDAEQVRLITMFDPGEAA